MADSSGLGVGAVVMVVQAGAWVGKMIGMEGVGRGVVGVDVVQDEVKRSKERRKPVPNKVEGLKENLRNMMFIDELLA